MKSHKAQAPFIVVIVLLVLIVTGYLLFQNETDETKKEGSRTNLAERGNDRPPGESTEVCGDKICSPSESTSTCPWDCNEQSSVPSRESCAGPSCSKGGEPRDDDEGTEEESNEEDDEEPVCGNDLCEAGESSQSCPSDCGSPAPPPPEDPHPSDLFDMNALKDIPSLQLTILKDEIYTNEEIGEDVRHIKIRFFSTTWFGVDIWNEADIYMPTTIPPERRGYGAMAHTERYDYGSSQYSMHYGFGERTALLADIPVMICTCVIPAQSYGYQGETELTRSFRDLMMDDGNVEREVAYVLTKIYIRALTAFSTLEAAYKPTKFISGGSSKRGLTQWVLAAVDNRIYGFLSSAYNSGNLLSFVDLVENDWNGMSEVIGNDPETTRAWLLSPNGTSYRQYFDPYEFTQSINVPFILTIGTNDHLSPPGAEQAFYPFVANNDNAFDAIANVGHTMQSEHHLRDWRALISRVVDTRKTPHIAATRVVTGTDLNVDATISNAEEIVAVRLWTASDTDKDFRDAQWSSQEMVLNNGGYTATASRSANRNLAYFVEVEDIKLDGRSFTTTMVEMIDRVA